MASPTLLGESADADDALTASISAYVSKQMAGHDPSHNPTHVFRVLSLARTLLAAETARHQQQTTNPQPTYNPTVLTLSALLHDIGDRKYLPPPTPADLANNLDEHARAAKLVGDVLVSHGADPSIAERVQVITSHVSYSTEVKNPALIKSLVEEYPELAIVQDADRLDALGAVGIARCFTFLGAKGGGGGGEWELEGSIRHFEEKLERLEGMMKTESGREMARVRTERLREFKGWWEEETGMMGGIWGV